MHIPLKPFQCSDEAWLLVFDSLSWYAQDQDALYKNQGMDHD